MGPQTSNHVVDSRNNIFRLTRQLNIPPQAIVYANLLALDYDWLAPLIHPENEVQQDHSLNEL